MSFTRHDAEIRGSRPDVAGRRDDAPFLAVAIACLLAVAVTAGTVQDSPDRSVDRGVRPAAEAPSISLSPGLAPSLRTPVPDRTGRPVFAVRRDGPGGPTVKLSGSLTAIDGRLAWNGVQAGMERRAVAARLGALPPAIAHPAGWCGEHESRVELPEGELILAFDGPGERSRLTSVTLVAADGDLAAGDSAEPAAVFQTAAGEMIAVEPGVGLTFGDVCLG